MREPAQLVSAAILRELRPLRDAISQDKAKNKVDVWLRETKKQMAVLDRLSIKKNRNSAKQIRNTIHRLQYQIRTAPRLVQNCGYVQPTFPNGPIFSVPKMLSLMDEALDKLATFSAFMDYTKALCASRAYSIMVKCSKKPPASSSENSPLRVIASLIYQHCTGKRQDLERACEDTLRRGGSWTWDDPAPQALFESLKRDFWAWLHARRVAFEGIKGRQPMSDDEFKQWLDTDEGKGGDRIF
jgi:hypothetical protein